MATPKAPGQKDAPDPSLGGSIRNIVASAHKWGGDGSKPRFDNVKRVLSTQHPEVVAKAFGGNPDVAAAWVVDNWNAIHGVTYQCADGTRSPQCWRQGGRKKGQAKLAEDENAEPAIVLSDQQIESLITNDNITHELYFAHPSSDVEEDSEGLIWKDILSTGQWKVHPNAVQAAKGEKFQIQEADLDQFIVNFEDGAWEHVTVPLTHEDKLTDNTGFIKKLVKKPDPNRRGQKILRAGIKFTDQGIKGKVLDGSIANISCGLEWGDVKRTTDGKIFNKVLKHAALTNAPFIKGLKPFGSADQIAASENDDWSGSLVMEPEETNSREGENMSKSFMDRIKEIVKGRVDNEEQVLADLDDLEIPEGLTAEDATKYLSELASLLDDEDDPDESDGDTTSEDKGPDSGKEKGSDNPDSSLEGGEITMSDDKDKSKDKDLDSKDKDTDKDKVLLSKDELNQLIQEKVSAAREPDQIELSRLRDESHERRVNDKIQQLENKGHAPAVLKEAKMIMLADKDSNNLITLSEDDDKEVKLTATDIVERILNSVPERTLLKFSRDTNHFDESTKKDDISSEIDRELEALRI